MHWLVLAGVGTVFGFIARFVMLFSSDVRTSFCLMLGIFGALAGGVLYGLSPSAIFGSLTFFVLGALVSAMALVGGLLAYVLTHRERRT